MQTAMSLKAMVRAGSTSTSGKFAGDRQRFPHPRLTRSLLERGIGVEVMDTAAACRTYNIIMLEGRRVAAALLMMAD